MRQTSQIDPKILFGAHMRHTKGQGDLLGVFFSEFLSDVTPRRWLFDIQSAVQAAPSEGIQTYTDAPRI